MGRIADQPAPLAEAVARGRRWLSSSRNDDGSWGYLPDQSGRPEATILAAAAGLPVATHWLRDHDLGWAQLLLPAAIGDADPELTRSAVEGILATESVRTPDAKGFDGNILGWSWVPGTAAWVEPTAYAVVSLSRAGHRDHPRAEAGRALLRDRQCSDGGWNYGNPSSMDKELAGQLGPTGWATLALPPSEAAERGLAFLARALDEPSTLALSMAALAHVRHARPAEAYTDALAERLGEHGVRSRVDLTALAVAAMACVAEERRVFW